MGKEIDGVSVEGPLIPLSELQINILRYLGKGLSRKETANKLNLSEREFGRKQKESFGILGVDGEVPAVMQALKLGILNVDADGLLDPDFDLKQFHRLRRSEKIVLDLLVESTSKILDKKDFEKSDIETSKDTKEYVWRSLRNVNNEIAGLPSRMQLLVHYYAFRKNEEFLLGQAGEHGMGNNSLGLGGHGLRILELLGAGISPSTIGLRLEIKVGTVYNYQSVACRKLGAKSVGEAISKAKEMGFIH